MRQRGLAAVSLAAVTLCTAVCGGCSSSTKTTGQAGSSSAATQSAMTSASASPSASAGAGGGTGVAVASVGKFGDILIDSQGKTLYPFEKDTSSTTTRTDGKTQIVYNSHPLYYFEGDKAEGDTKGEESSAFGAKWYVVNPAGNKVEGD